MSSWSDLKYNPRLKKIYDDRIQIIKLIREFFWSLDFRETETPAAILNPGQEPYLNPVSLVFHDPSGQGTKFYLRTSPEYALKKLLAVGYEKIFELAKCFRDFESFGGNHNTEFTLLEWYRAPGSYVDFMDDMENLFKYVGEKMNIKLLRYKDKEVNLFNTWERLSMKKVWQQHVGVNLDDYLTRDNLKNLAIKQGFAVEDKDSYDDIFFKIFLNKIEPNLGLERPLFVYDYPAQMTSLSQLCQHDPRYGERVECYIAGLEMCNGYGELTDSVEQEKKLEKDRQLRQDLGKDIWPVDPDFISALGDLPVSARKSMAGVALGVDRMVVLFTGAKDINEVIFGSINNQLNN